MKRTGSILLLICLTAVFYGVYSSFWAPNVIAPESQNNLIKKQFYDYAGVMNVQTLRSSGSGSLETIAEAANLANLDFVILTDINDFSQMKEPDHYRQRTLFLSGGKYSYLDARLINFDWNSPDLLQGPGRSQTLFAEILSQKKSVRPEGLFVLCHPLKPGFELSNYPPGLDGIEIFNLKSIWQNTWNRSRGSFFWTLFVYPFNSDLAFIRMLPGATDDEFRLWDKLLKVQNIFGYAGTDADAKFRISENQFLVFPSYKVLFSIVRNHIWTRSELTGEVSQDRNKIINAFRSGEFYLGLDILGDSTGFTNFLTRPKDSELLPGAEVPFQNGMQIVASLEKKPNSNFEIVVQRDGEKLVSSNSQTTTYNIPGPGVYRTYVRVKISLPIPEGNKWITWIASNPFFIRP